MAYYNYSYSLPYVLFFSAILLISLKITNSERTSSIVSVNLFKFYALGLFFIFFIGFRGFIYTDWGAYYRVYKDTPSLLSSRNEISLFLKKYPDWNSGYMYYSMFFKTLKFNYTLFQVSSFIIDFIILYKIFNNFFHNLNLTILAFCFFILFGGVLGFGIEINLMRNAKSIICFLISLKYIQTRKIIPFLLLILLGFLFHPSALLYIPCYFLLKRNFSRKIVVLLFVIGNIIYLLHIQWLRELLLLINSIVTTPLSPLIEFYLNSTKFGGNWGFSIGYLERTFSFILIFIFEQKLIDDNHESRMYVNSFYIFIFIYLYCSEIAILLDRVGLLFIFPYWFLYPQIYKMFTREKKYIFVILFLFYGILKCATCNNILYYYENTLLPHMTYEIRYPIMKSFNKYLDRKALKGASK